MRRPKPPEKPQRSAKRPSRAALPAGQEQEIHLDTDRWSGFRDSFGEREVGIDAEGGAIELLRLAREFTPVEQALSDRVSRLKDFDRPAVARPLRLEQDDRTRRPRLILVSDRIPGVRLSELLLRGIGRSVVPDLGVALFVMRRLLSTAAKVQTSTGLAHFIIAPERVVITPRGEVVVVEAALAGAIEALAASTGVPKGLRLARSEANAQQEDPRVDITRIARIGISLMLGRALDADESVDALSSVLGEAADVAAIRAGDGFSTALSLWLEQAVTIDADASFPDFQRADAALQRTNPPNNCVASRLTLQAFLQDLAVEHLSDPETVALEAERIRGIRTRQIAARPAASVARTAWIDSVALELGLPHRDEILQESPEEIAANPLRVVEERRVIDVRGAVDEVINAEAVADLPNQHVDAAPQATHAAKDSMIRSVAERFGFVLRDGVASKPPARIVPPAVDVAAESAEPVAEMPEEQAENVFEAPGLLAPELEEPGLEEPVEAAPAAEPVPSPARTVDEPVAKKRGKRSWFRGVAPAPVQAIEVPGEIETALPGEFEAAPPTSDITEPLEGIAEPLDAQPWLEESMLEEQTTLEEPMAFEERAMLEEPAVLEEPVVFEEPVSFEEPITFEEWLTLEEPQTLEEPLVLEEPSTVAEPALIEEAITFGKPLIIEVRLTIAEPVMLAKMQPVLIHAPAVLEERALLEEPRILEEPVRLEEQVRLEEPTLLEGLAVAVFDERVTFVEPVAIGRPVAIEEPVTIEKPVLIEVPVLIRVLAVLEEPVLIREPTVLEEPALVEEPAMLEGPALIEEPAVLEEPALIEEPAVLEEPTPSDRPDATLEAPALEETIVEPTPVVEIPITWTSAVDQIDEQETIEEEEVEEETVEEETVEIEEADARSSWIKSMTSQLGFGPEAEVMRPEPAPAEPQPAAAAAPPPPKPAAAQSKPAATQTTPEADGTQAKLEPNRWGPPAATPQRVEAVPVAPRWTPPSATPRAEAAPVAAAPPIRIEPSRQHVTHASQPARGYRLPDVAAAASQFMRSATILVVAVGVVGGLAWAGRQYYVRQTSPGTVVIESNPRGAEILVDGASKGVTPLTIALSPGKHALELRRRGVPPRQFTLDVNPGEQLKQQIDMSNARAVGTLVVTSNPIGARVLVDGKERGVTPLTLPDLSPGAHAVALDSTEGSVLRTVQIQAGGSVTLDEAIFAGWIAVFAPFELQIYEGKRFLGTTENERIMLKAGRHELELVNTHLGFRETRAIEVKPGATVPVNVVQSAQGILRIAAPDGAEVFIDGKRVGETPLAEQHVSLGTREIVVKHPQLGEKRITTTVTSSAPAEVKVDFGTP